ncbi:MAG: hypothetical protein KDC98_05980, partial [Planctomycetes bacterium]|nr:hypothetical protein [Planctomycetota bacterium]
MRVDITTTLLWILSAAFLSARCSGQQSFAEAEALFAAGRHAAALERIEAAIAVNADSLDCRYLHAHILTALGRAAEAAPVREAIVRMQQQHLRDLDLALARIRPAGADGAVPAVAPQPTTDVDRGLTDLLEQSASADVEVRRAAMAELTAKLAALPATVAAQMSTDAPDAVRRRVESLLAATALPPAARVDAVLAVARSPNAVVAAVGKAAIGSLLSHMIDEVTAHEGEPVDGDTDDDDYGGEYADPILCAAAAYSEIHGPQRTMELFEPVGRWRRPTANLLRFMATTLERWAGAIETMDVADPQRVASVEAMFRSLSHLHHETHTRQLAEDGLARLLTSRSPEVRGRAEGELRSWAKQRVAAGERARKEKRLHDAAVDFERAFACDQSLVQVAEEAARLHDANGDLRSAARLNKLLVRFGGEVADRAQARLQRLWDLAKADSGEVARARADLPGNAGAMVRGLLAAVERWMPVLEG